jgi:hypothetical protein
MDAAERAHFGLSQMNKTVGFDRDSASAVCKDGDDIAKGFEANFSSFYINAPEETSKLDLYITARLLDDTLPYRSTRTQILTSPPPGHI